MTAFQETAPAVMPVLVFALGGERFAIPAEIVNEILDPVPVTDVPHARAFVGGLINVRGKVVPLADLRLLLGLPVTARTIDTRFIVINLDLHGEALCVGILADRVHEVRDIEAAAVEDVPLIGLKWRPEFVSGIGKIDGDFIILPNLVEIFGLN